ncbi:DUF3179 domain-containing protein [bacterium]|nr:DUF3179 domain-containing protein [bacterium]
MKHKKKRKFSPGPIDSMIVIRYDDDSLPRVFNPFMNPQWVDVSNAMHMKGADPVLGLLVNEKAFALPWWIMKNHHVANLILDDQPILVKLCEVCSSSAAFVPVVDDRRLTFRVDGVYNGTFYTIDFETGSIWAPFTGESLHGPHKGKKLTRHPVYQSTWEEWAKLYPNCLVPYGPQEARTGHGAKHYPGAPERSGNFAEGLLHRDERLPDHELVLGVEAGDKARAYPLNSLNRLGSIWNDSIHGQDIVIFSRPDSWMAMAFSRRVNGSSLTFGRDQAGNVVDETNQSRWDISGTAISGPMVGTRLPVVHAWLEEWSAWVTFHPQTELFDE